MTDRTQVRALAELMEALTQSMGALTGLIQDCGNPPALFVIRDALTLTKEGMMGIAASSGILAPTRH